jgi:uncharacterized membrane protein YvbJ
MARKWKGKRDYFICPHCGAEVPEDAVVCRECGSDVETGWAKDADKWEVNIPAGYGEEEDFNYGEFLSRDFPEHASPISKKTISKWVMLIVVVIVSVAILILLLAL